MTVLPTSSPAAPPITHRLLAQGPDTLGHETTLARAPIWAARGNDKPVQLALLSGPLVLHGVDFCQVEGAQLTVAEQRLVAELTTLYIANGCPVDRLVRITLTEIASVLGYLEPGAGKAIRAARQSLARIRSVTFSSALRAAEPFPRIWGLIDTARPLRRSRPTAATRRDGGTVTLNDELAQLLREGHVTFLNLPTWDAISREDRYAGRLWCYLEAEQISSGWNYSLFASTPGGMLEERNMPAIADLLLLDWPQRRQVTARIAKACRTIQRHDARYSLEIIKGRQKGMWHLRAHRDTQRQSQMWRPLPASILAGWRAAFGARRPSARQMEVLAELSHRRGGEWVNVQLQATTDDPFASMMESDRVLSSEDRKRELEAEREWQRRKEADSAQAPQALAAILNGLAERGLALAGSAPPEARPGNRTSSDVKPDSQ